MYSHYVIALNVGQYRKTFKVFGLTVNSDLSEKGFEFYIAIAWHSHICSSDQCQISDNISDIVIVMAKECVYGHQSRSKQ